MRRTIRSILCAISLLALVPSLAHAQVATGAPPFGSFGGGPDIINLANLNAHITVPVIHRAGRGTNFTYDLSYDTSVWYPVASGGTTSWQPAWNWGFTGQTQITTGYVSYRRIFGDCGTGHGRVPYNTYTFKFYNDQFGTPHPINLTVDDSAQKCSSPIGQFSASTTLNNGSGYKVSVNAVPAATVYATHGTTFYPPHPLGVGPGTFTDRNGNQVVADNSGNFFDTLSSATRVLSVVGSGTPTSPMTFTYTAPSGANASYTMKFTAYTVKTNFACSGVTEYGPTANNLVSEIDLPDGSKYSFTYEPTPGFSGEVTGRLASVTLPTGGTITYGYSGGSNGITCSDGSASGYTRQTPDGTWTYARTRGSGAASTTTITDPQGNVTVSNFSGIYPTQSRIYQGSTSGTLLKTILICYNNNYSNCPTAPITLPITFRDLYIYYPNLANPSDRETAYNAYGLVTMDKQIDFVPSSGGSPFLSMTQISYANLGNGIVSMPSSVQVFNNSGTVVSQTNYNYDETAVTTTSGTPQHVAISGSRGNLTSVNQLVQGTTNLTSHATYFDTGTPSAVNWNTTLWAGSPRFVRSQRARLHGPVGTAHKPRPRRATGPSTHTMHLET